MSSTFHAVKSPMKRWKIVLRIIAYFLAFLVIVVAGSVIMTCILWFVRSNAN